MRVAFGGAVAVVTLLAFWATAAFIRAGSSQPDLRALAVGVLWLAVLAWIRFGPMTGFLGALWAVGGPRHQSRLARVVSACCAAAGLVSLTYFVAGAFRLAPGLQVPWILTTGVVGVMFLPDRN